jgi:hypothetical protein
MVDHNNWTPRDRPAYFITALNERPYTFYKASLRGLRKKRLVRRSRTARVTSACKKRSTLSWGPSASGESLQEFVADVDHLAHRAHVYLPQQHISIEADRSFASCTRHARRHSVRPSSCRQPMQRPERLSGSGKWHPGSPGRSGPQERNEGTSDGLRVGIVGAPVTYEESAPTNRTRKKIGAG